ncbi:SigE family RNA polymerase sigma factor [Streptomyces yaizuensis]|uniref:SigE family RNA polymerase sigma factor n=2 Tax=Streptomyces yaizuensis TaxID=2989713 RepID=A0ABQ5NTB6_9ACTN|nr:SigE family RNA polymerase sigma factor [Streptomyces sp. YSPA8]
MLRTARLLTGNHHDAEDLVQSALVKAYVKWERVRRADEPDAYVWRIMINANTDRVRLLRVREWLTTRVPECPVPDRADDIAERGALTEALSRLPARQRAVIVLRYLEDRSESEVADILGTHVGTVRSHAARALYRLREQPGVLAEWAGLPDAARTGVGPRPEEARS